VILTTMFLDNADLLRSVSSKRLDADLVYGHVVIGL